MSFDELYPDLGVAADRAAGHGLSVAMPLLVPARGSRSSPVFNAHSYHTKVPAEAIEPFIEHHTKPGAAVLDPFAGSGMTGVAARRLGRRAILNDLSPAAAHIAWNLTHECDPGALGGAAERALAMSQADAPHLYRASCGGCGGDASIAYTIWSDVLACPACGSGVSVWRHGVDRATGVVANTMDCGDCHATWRRRGARRIASDPTWVVTDCRACGRFERAVAARDLMDLDAIAAGPLDHWHPTNAIGAEREMFIRSALGSRGIATVADFYTPRNLRALSALWAAILAEPDPRLRQTLAFAFTNTAWHGTIMRRYNARGGQRPLTGTLYVPHLSSEVNVNNVFAHKVRQLQKFYATEWRTRDAQPVQVRVGSAAGLAGLADRSIDYVFTDPPFGSNIFYADCNFIWESWLGRLTDQTDEAVVNRSLRPRDGGKTLADYRTLMESSFAEIARVLRPDAWMTVVFHSSDAAVWQALEDAAKAAGLSIHGATYLDKNQLSPKGYKGRSGTEDVAAYDVVLGMRNRPASSRRSQVRESVRRTRAATILFQHLEALPAVGIEPDADRLRTLPYLHSLLVQHHFNGDIGLHIGDYDTVRSICDASFVQDSSGRWSIPVEHPETYAAIGDSAP